MSPNHKNKRVANKKEENEEDSQADKEKKKAEQEDDDNKSLKIIYKNKAIERE